MNNNPHVLQPYYNDEALAINEFNFLTFIWENIDTALDGIIQFLEGEQYRCEDFGNVGTVEVAHDGTALQFSYDKTGLMREISLQKEYLSSEFGVTVTDSMLPAELVGEV